MCSCSRFKYLKSRGEFRGSYIYSSLLYGIVTYITELIGGDSWENLVKKHLFDPLGMMSSTFVTTASPKDIAIAAGYIEYYGELHSVPFEFSRQVEIDLVGSISNLLNLKNSLKM